MDNKYIEILMATYNGSLYVGEQIDSILNQTDSRWHLTVSDDCSDDGTDEILDSYVSKYPDKISRVYSNTRFGNAKDHFFWLMDNCSAEYMMFSDQDDVFYPEKVKCFLDEIVNVESSFGPDKPFIILSDQKVVDGELEEIAPSLMRYQNQYFKEFDYRSIIMQNVVTGGAMAFNRELSLLAMSRRDRSRIIMHDWWLGIVAARFGHIAYMDKPLSAYRQHSHNVVGAKNSRSFSYYKLVLKNTDKLKMTIKSKKMQALFFKESFAAAIDDEDRFFLDGFSKGRSGVCFYLRYRKEIHGIHRLLGFSVFG